METVYPSMYFGMELIGESGTLNSVANIYHNGLRIAAVAQNGAKDWYLQDQVDSGKLVMGAAGQVLSRAEYLPYGETFVQKGDEDFAPKYNSQELDRETNFYFYNARHYDPQIARFTSADTIIAGNYETQGWNRYMYVHGNPIGAKDPTGHAPVAIPALIPVIIMKVTYGGLIGGTVGAITEYGVQIGKRVADGKSIGDAIAGATQDRDSLNSIKNATIAGAVAGAMVAPQTVCKPARIYFINRR